MCQYSNMVKIYSLLSMEAGNNKKGITMPDFIFPCGTEIFTWLEYSSQFLSPEKGSKMRMHTVLDPTAKTYD